MAGDPNLDPDESPRWVRVWWPPASRAAVFVIGAWLAFDGDTDIKVTGGFAAMLAAAGFAIAKGGR